MAAFLAALGARYERGRACRIARESSALRDAPGSIYSKISGVSGDMFPGASWEAVDPAAAGWNVQGLQAVQNFAQSLGSTAVMIVQGGKVVAVADGDMHFGVNVGPGSFSARGHGGSVILVAPAHDLVVVHQVDYNVNKNVTYAEFGQLLQLILSAAPSGQ